MMCYEKIYILNIGMQ